VPRTCRQDHEDQITPMLQGEDQEDGEGTPSAQ